ncbi:MAG: S-layer homology domain-containing protein [Candidatus Wallbacteria bacterium]|nr:S-layer homology domain-containing protein [Candidatus Wallbacteria bacterium]
MRISSLLLAALLLVPLTSQALAAANPVGVVVRDGADPSWPGALVLRDVLQKPTIIGLLPEGTEVRILPHLSNKTYSYIAADGIRGWVKKEYVHEMPGVSAPRKGPGFPKPILFSDIPVDHWARKAVERMVSAGLIERHTDRFMGNKPVTRYELAIVLDRTFKRVEQNRENIEARLKALEAGSAGAPTIASAPMGGQYRSLLTLAQTIQGLKEQSEELKGRIDALDTSGSREVLQKLRILEHRIDTIERTLGNG